MGYHAPEEFEDGSMMPLYETDAFIHSHKDVSNQENPVDWNQPGMPQEAKAIGGEPVFDDEFSNHPVLNIDIDNYSPGRTNVFGLDAPQKTTSQNVELRKYLAPEYRKYADPESSESYFSDDVTQGSFV